MWWSNDVDDAVEIAHVCSDSCAKAIRGSWVCTMNGTVLGPALLENIKIPKPQTPIKNRADCNPAARGRFVTSVQALLTKLVKGDKRTKVEGARAGKGRVHALRNATRSVQSDIEKGKLPNVGIALCVAWTSYEKSTNALDVLAELDQDTETHLLQECGDFFCPGVQECRPKLDALALAILFFMRDGIPGKLKSSKFLFANLPDLSRLKNYDIPISSFTHGRRYIQSVLDEDA